MLTQQPDLLPTLLTQLFKSSPSIGLVIGFFVINLGISLLITFLLVTCIKADVIKRKRAFAFLLLSIGTFIPVLGSLMAILFVCLLKKYTKDFQPIEINLYPAVEYSRKNAINTVAYGSSWADVRLYSEYYSQKERQQALYSLQRGLPRDTNPIYSTLVSDDFEELRVCAFSMLEIQQDYLQTKINQLLKKYEEESQSHKKAFLAKQVALLYWELVYRNLSSKEFRLIVLERSDFFAKTALEVLTTDATLLLLLSRINMENEKLEQSMDYLLKASENHAPSSKIIPYLAELAYKNKDYGAVKQYLDSDASLQYLFKINKIVNFWCQNAKTIT